MRTTVIRILLLISWCWAAGAAAAPEDEYRAGAASYRSGDVVQAMALLKKPADAGHAGSQALLAYILDKAEFNEEAIAYYRKAAAQGNADGEFGLGSMVAAGDGVKRDLAEAQKWILRAADKGHAQAIESLAQAYIVGGLGLDDAQRQGSDAARWITRAANNNFLPAIERLAAAYRAGHYGLAVDIKKAEALELQVRNARGVAAKTAPNKKGSK